MKFSRTVATATGLCLGMLGTVLMFGATTEVGGTRATATYQRIKAHLDGVAAIDTHDHLRPFELLPGRVETDKGRGMTLASVWQSSYLTWIQPITPWPPGGSFDDWWSRAKKDFDTVRAASVYRYTLVALHDLYGVDFETATDAEARQLSDRIFAHDRDPKWLHHVVTERANIELMFNDAYWNRLGFAKSYPWEVLVFNVTSLVDGYHPANFPSPNDNPYLIAAKEGSRMETLDDYLAMLDRLFAKARQAGAVCLKSTLAYRRTLSFENVPKARASQAFGRPRNVLTAQEIKDFEDFVMWRLCELGAKYGLPLQIHTGHARIQGSNPMLLVDLMEANPQTKFILFHGGYPWVGETGVIVARALHKARNVWIDSNWLPILSYDVAKRSYHEWLDVVPSDRIMWGGDSHHAVSIYGATAMTRRCLSEVLAERVMRGDLREEMAVDIGRRILRENALTLFPQLRERLWKHKEQP